MEISFNIYVLYPTDETWLAAYTDWEALRDYILDDFDLDIEYTEDVKTLSAREGLEIRVMSVTENTANLTSLNPFEHSPNTDYNEEEEN